VRVLFLCTGNSARSQIGEALLQRAGGGLVQVASAGSHPKAIRPDAVRVLREYGIDVLIRRVMGILVVAIRGRYLWSGLS
jgi:protein-tyrosine-phosphatase